MTFTVEPGSLLSDLEHAYHQLTVDATADALWSRRLDVWSRDVAVQQRVAGRLGWLDAIAFARAHVPRIRACGQSVRGIGLTDVVLLGMGGSSLAPEVLRTVVGVAPGYPRFCVLDSVDPDAVRSAMARPASTLFVLASKSGSTIEPNGLAAEAIRRLRDAGVAEPGSRFIAITDEGTALHRRAIAECFRDLFVNPSDIGGRYSALSLFGLVPAAMMGIDLEELLTPATALAETCRNTDPRSNPGLALGAFMAAAAQAGRDKLVLALPAALEPFGLWVEQLVAESTGKDGTGVLPIAGESGAPSLARDRAVVRIVLGDDDRTPDGLDAVRAAGVPIITLHLPDTRALGAEFFRWEVATATAGLLLKVNPFDEPNVQQAKDSTRRLLDLHAATQRLPRPEPDAVADGVSLTMSQSARQDLESQGPFAFLRLLRPGDYFALLAYLPPDAEALTSVLQRLRTAVAAASGCATTFGFGPRYLHSTGQLHKGGPNTGVFLIVTADASEDLAVPGEPYTFGVLEQAQAIGDFESLAHARRRVLQVHLPDRDPIRLERLCAALLQGQA